MRPRLIALTTAAAVLAALCGTATAGDVRVAAAEPLPDVVDCTGPAGAAASAPATTCARAVRS